MRVVELSWHALEQFRERFPEHSATSSYIRLLVATDVNEAFDAGRYSSKQPKWCREDGRQAKGKRNGHERDRTFRYVWTADHHRVYLVDKKGALLRVVTSIRPDDRRSA